MTGTLQDAQERDIVVGVVTELYYPTLEVSKVRGGPCPSDSASFPLCVTLGP